MSKIKRNTNYHVIYMNKGVKVVKVEKTKSKAEVLLNKLNDSDEKEKKKVKNSLDEIRDFAIKKANTPAKSIAEIIDDIKEGVEKTPRPKRYKTYFHRAKIYEVQQRV